MPTSDAQLRELACPPPAASRRRSRSCPSRSVSSRLMVRHSVDLPDPEGPSTTTTWPRSTSRLMSLSTCRSPKCLLTPWIEIIGDRRSPLASVHACADPTQVTRSLPGTARSDDFSGPHSAPYDEARDVGADPATSRRATRPRSAAGAHLPGPHLRLPDERARLRAARRAAGGRRLPAGAPTAPTPTWWCSTPARCARTPTTSSTATSATWRRASRPTPTCRSPSAAAWRRRTATAVLRKAPWVDVVFGTHNIGSLPALLERARHNRVAQVEIVESLQEFPSTLPAARESAYAAWVSISVGCNNTCTFCIVPVAARQGGRPPARRHPRRGAARWSTRASSRSPCWARTSTPTACRSPTREHSPRDRGAFAELLRACGDIDGLERVRFTSPHPAEFTDDVIEAMAETPERLPDPAHAAAVRLRPHAARRCAGPTGPRSYLGIIDRVRAAMPHAAITTDIIVGFPGETEEDFAATLDVVRAGPLRHRVHLPVLQAARHPGRRPRRSAAQSRCAGTLSCA